MAETDDKTPESGSSQPGKVTDRTVQLGCGTLILIAIIVLLFSGRGEVEELQREMSQLEQQLAQINSKLDLLLEER